MRYDGTPGFNQQYLGPAYISDSMMSLQKFKLMNISFQASGSGHVIVKLEQELKQIQSVMEGLSTQGSKISEEIGNLKAPNSSGSLE